MLSETLVRLRILFSRRVRIADYVRASDFRDSREGVRVEVWGMVPRRVLSPEAKEVSARGAAVVHVGEILKKVQHF